MSLDLSVCSRARLARDARFDGKFFIGTLTTKIYCRPTCRSRTSQERTFKDRTSARELASVARRTGKADNSSALIGHIPPDNRNTRAILKELVSNSHGVYLLLEPRRLEEEKLERAVVISRQRSGDNKGRMFIEDNGLGQSLKHLLRKIQTSIRRDLERLKTRSGPGKLCSWPILSAGSKVIIESSAKGIAGELHVEINVRRIYDKMVEAISVDDIVGNSECISVTKAGMEQQ